MCVWAHLADTVVVNDTQSLTKVSGVVPVISSHCAGEVPPVKIGRLVSRARTLTALGRQGVGAEMLKSRSN